ncbi:MAG: SIR2 family protein [Gallionella sp.]
MTDTRPLTPFLLESIQRGDAVLFLGAGASIGAKSAGGVMAPKNEELRDRLSDEFLGGQLKSNSLSQVAEYSKSEANLPEVEQFIKECFDPLQPANFHLLIPSFRWFSIVTTNFDLVVERSYEQCKNRLQILSPIIQDGDRFSDVLRDVSQVPYLKLYGCISHIGNPNLPLILASEEYAKYKKNRERLFRHFADWARERPIIFCGYDVADPNIHQILFDLNDMGVSRPMYGLVNPGVHTSAESYWSGKRFSVYPKSFETFLVELDECIPKANRALASLLTTTKTSIQSLIKSHATPSTELLRYLQDELEHVFKGMPTLGVLPNDFYKGQNVGWGAIQQGLDVKRRISDDVVLEAFLGSDSNSLLPEIYLVKGYAGSGKSITLRRIAWDIANEFNGTIFFLKEGGLIRREQLLELFTLIGERVFIVIEDAVPHVKDLQAILPWAEKNHVPITLILGARTNEWNVYSGELEARTKNEYELRDLTEHEIGLLIKLLEKHKALNRLANATELERLDHFKLSSERQLLVALHDLNSDKPFEEIVYDEFKKIVPQEARILYLDICSLHRLGVGVRAGLVSRISGINFEQFNRDFFRPLEHVIHTYFDYRARDNMYRSRHREIAEMVFSQALREPSERADQIVRIIRNMDIDYESDAAAFRQILRGKALADLFADKNLALRIFVAALESGAHQSVIEHQRAVFELNHRAGDLQEALKAIERAASAHKHIDKAILHTKASILRELALISPHKLMRSRLRDEAKDIIKKHINSSRVPHPYNTLGLIFVDELIDMLGEAPEENDNGLSELKDRAIADVIRHTEQVIADGLQRFPGDEYLLSLEATFARILADEKRALSALSKAFEASPGRGFIAVRYASALQRQGDSPKAIDVLTRSIATNPAGKEAHFALAKIYISIDEVLNKDEINYHLKHSFTQGDSNLDAQFWYARQNFIYGDRELAQTIFSALGKTWIPAEYRNDVKGVILDVNGNGKRFSGSIKRVEDYYCYIVCPDLHCDIFAHGSDFIDEDWKKISSGTRVSFVLGFSFRGPRTKHVRLMQ